MDIGKAAEIFEHYITIAIGKAMTPGNRQELGDAVEAFKQAAIKLRKLYEQPVPGAPP